MKKNKRIPVTLLTGFLGAGKTTLLLRLLKEGGVGRVAVIVNEFGEIGIDGALLRDVAPDVVELPGGALCCQSSGDVTQALTKLWDVSEDLDRVVIETTGLADPLPIAKMFFNRPTLERQYVLDAVVTVVDAVHGMERLESEEWKQQIEMATLMLVSKTDLTGGVVPMELESELHRLNPCGEVTTDAARLFSHSAKDLLSTTVPETPSRHAHSNGITSVYLKTSEPLSFDAVSRFIGEHLVLNGDRLLRYKGIFYMADREERFVFQGMGFSFEHLPDRLWKADETRESVLVLIGNQLKKEEFEEAFLACCTSK